MICTDGVERPSLLYSTWDCPNDATYKITDYGRDGRAYISYECGVHARSAEATNRYRKRLGITGDRLVRIEKLTEEEIENIKQNNERRAE